jgi:hypothetical protein
MNKIIERRRRNSPLTKLWPVGAALGDGADEQGASGFGLLEKETSEGEWGGGHEVLWEGRMARHAVTACATRTRHVAGEQPAHWEETTLKQTFDFSQEIRPTLSGDPVRLCMSPGNSGKRMDDPSKTLCFH